MRRRLFDMMAFAALMLCIALMLLWWRTFATIDTFDITRTTFWLQSDGGTIGPSYRTIELCTASGVLSISDLRDPRPGDADREGPAWWDASLVNDSQGPYGDQRMRLRLTDFQFQRGVNSAGVPVSYTLRVPITALAIVAVITPLVWIRKRDRSALRRVMVNLVNGRMLLNVVTACSVVLFVGVAILWPRSYFEGTLIARDIGGLSQRRPQLVMELENGRVRIFHTSPSTLQSIQTKAFRSEIEKLASEIEARAASEDISVDRHQWDIGRTDPSLARVSTAANESGFAGFEAATEEAGNNYPAVMTIHRYGAPCWALLALTGALPLWRGMAFVRTRRTEYRSANGLCQTCGYDMRATPQRCPECGATRVDAIPQAS